MDSSVPWQNYIFFVVSVPSYILYLTILGVVCIGRVNHKRFRSTFYGLVLSLGVADIFSTSTACFSNIIRTSNIWTEFYWNNREWIGVMSYNTANFAIMIRLFGATLIALQRYALLCYGHTSFSKRIAYIPLIVVFTIHWIPPLIYSSPITLDFNKSLMGPDDMRLKIAAQQQQLGALMQNIFILVTFSISAFAYIKILRLIIQTKWSTTGRSREFRLSIVALGQGLAFTITFTYFFLQYFFNAIGSPFVDGMRPYMTLLTALISYWNPWIYIFLNGDIREEIRSLLGIPEAQESSVVVSSLTRNVPNGTTSLQSFNN